ncbi:hypothetical protein [Staphylococcus epidermidis]|nr:hypothetical protein [Staphylococcus epidermidis]
MTKFEEFKVEIIICKMDFTLALLFILVANDDMINHYVQVKL